MSSAAKNITRRDLREMLALAAEASRLGPKARMPLVLARLIEMTGADAGLVLRVRRTRASAKFDVLTQHGTLDANAPEDLDRPVAPRGPTHVSSIYPLRRTGHYACVKLFRAAGFDARQDAIAGAVWQAIGSLHG